MKNAPFNPHKDKFLKIDFYVQCFFFALTLLFVFSSLFSGYFVFLRMFFIIPIAIYCSIALVYHLIKGSYSKQIELFRKIHLISVLIYSITFVFVFFMGNNAANQNEMTFLIFWTIPPIFLTAYFFITWLDWKAMKKLEE